MDTEKPVRLDDDELEAIRGHLRLGYLAKGKLYDSDVRLLLKEVDRLRDIEVPDPGFPFQPPTVQERLAKLDAIEKALAELGYSPPMIAWA